jgi:peroxiredoxin
MHAIRLLVLSIVTASALSGSVALARPRGGLPPTGLRGISYAKAPPDFQFDDGRGPRRLGALLGRPVVRNFWDTWCGPCRDELSAFTQLETTFGEAVALITVSDEAPGVARAFLAGHAVQLPVVEDPGRKIFSAYGVQKVPVTLVLGRDGTVGHVSVGELDWKELRDAVERALMEAGRPAT